MSTLLTVRRLMELTGKSRSGVMALIYRRELPAKKLGETWYVRRRVFCEFIGADPAEPLDELDRRNIEAARCDTTPETLSPSGPERPGRHVG